MVHGVVWCVERRGGGGKWDVWIWIILRGGNTIFCSAREVRFGFLWFITTTRIH